MTISRRVIVARDPAGERAAADARAIVPTGTRRAGEAQFRVRARRRAFYFKDQGKKVLDLAVSLPVRSRATNGSIAPVCMYVPNVCMCKAVKNVQQKPEYIAPMT